MIRCTTTISNKLGLHARASAKLTKLAASFPCEVWMSRGGRRVNAKSIMGVMMLAAGLGAEVEIEAPTSGVLRHVYVQPGEVVPCGTLLAAITADGDDAFDPAALRAWLERAKSSQAELIELPEHVHELMFESDWSETVDRIADWLDRLD